MEFYLNHGENPSQYIITRLYGCQKVDWDPDRLKVKYVHYICGEERWDWDDIENWPEHAKPFLRKRYFKFACFGTRVCPTDARQRMTRKDEKLSDRVRWKQRKKGISHVKKKLIPDVYRQGEIV